jgi:hypothetical protein
MSRTIESRFVRIPEDMYRKIVAMAKEEDRSIASTVRVCIVAELRRRQAEAEVGHGR